MVCKASDKKKVENKKSKTANNQPKDTNGKELVDKYIAGFPKTTQALLEKK